VGLTGPVVPFPLDLAATGPFRAEKIFGYSPYNPTIIQKLLDIFRVHYNYCKPEEKARKGRDGKPLPRRTPAMKLGMAKGLVRIEDILYFYPDEDEADRQRYK
jgi:hypothetical protein